MVIALRIGSQMILDSTDLDAGTINYVDFVPIGVIAIQELDVSSLNFFLMYFSFFKFLQNVPRMNAILLTVSSAAFDLVLFIVMAVIVQFGFSCAFYVCFGGQLAEYRTVGEATTTLMKILLGDFDYGALVNANRVMAPVLFFLYQLFVFFILLNMFVAIINDSYAEVKGNQTEEDLNYYSNLMKKISGRIMGIFQKKKQLNQLVDELQKTDANADNLIDEEELAAVLQNNPKTLEILKASGAKELMAKYDVSGDGVLDKEEEEEEMTAILREIAEKEAALANELSSAQDELNELQESTARPGEEGGGVTFDTSELSERIDNVEGQIKEMSRNLAKKMSLMIDLMMSLSDQVSSTREQMAPGMAMVPMPPQ